MTSTTTPPLRVLPLVLAVVACGGPDPLDDSASPDLIDPGSFGIAGSLGIEPTTEPSPTALPGPFTTGAGGAGGNSAAGEGGAAGDGANAAPNVLLTEYVEGSASNKALELVNRGGAALDIARCSVDLYTNGAAVTSRRIALGPGTLLPDEGWILCHPSSQEPILAVCRQTSGSLNYNGNDALVVLCDGQIMDSLGQVGVDPGTGWSSGVTRTADATLVRDCSVEQGDRIPGDAFDPMLEWHHHRLDVFDFLGDPSCEASPEPGAGGAGGHPAVCD